MNAPQGALGGVLQQSNPIQSWASTSHHKGCMPGYASLLVCAQLVQSSGRGKQPIIGYPRPVLINCTWCVWCAFQENQVAEAAAPPPPPT
jgi:hypothetical protein